MTEGRETAMRQVTDSEGPYADGDWGPRLYTATDRTGRSVYRRWRTTEEDARRYFERVGYADLLIGPQGEVLIRRG